MLDGGKRGAVDDAMMSPSFAPSSNYSFMGLPSVVAV